MTTGTIDISLGEVTANITAEFTPPKWPLDHVRDAHQLTGSGRVILLKIQMLGGVEVYLVSGAEVTWQGQTYQTWPFNLSGVGDFGDEQVSRPTLVMSNKRGLFSYYVDQGVLEGATVTRYRVLRRHIELDQPVSQKRTWLLTRVISLNSEQISCELRTFSDGPNFLVPARQFIPPEFPAVSI